MKNKIKMQLREMVEPKLGYLMVRFDLPEMKTIHDLIDKEDIYDEDGFGLETEVHCTLLYGFHDDKTTPNEVLDSIIDMPYPDLTLSNASLFENEYDVLKFDVVSDDDDLVKINKKLTDNFEYSTDYPDYHPHCTIGYLKKGMGKKYVEALKGMTFKVTPKKLIYSDNEKRKTSRAIK